MDSFICSIILNSASQITILFGIIMEYFLNPKTIESIKICKNLSCTTFEISNNILVKSEGKWMYIQEFNLISLSPVLILIVFASLVASGFTYFHMYRKITLLNYSNIDK